MEVLCYLKVNYIRKPEIILVRLDCLMAWCVMYRRAHHGLTKQWAFISARSGTCRAKEKGLMEEMIISQNHFQSYLNRLGKDQGKAMFISTYPVKRRTRNAMPVKWDKDWPSSTATYFKKMKRTAFNTKSNINYYALYVLVRWKKHRSPSDLKLQYR